jgi:hypothetical protein
MSEVLLFQSVAQNKKQKHLIKDASAKVNLLKKSDVDEVTGLPDPQGARVGKYLFL